MEIVDLTSNSMVGGFVLAGTAAVTSLAVTSGGQRIFLADACSNQVHVYTPQGVKVVDVAITSPRDLVLSPDGSTLYVAAATQIVAVDTATYDQTEHVALDASDNARGMGSSPDGTGVYYSIIHRFSGGGADTLDLLDTGALTFTRGTYTFSDASRSARDMRLVQIPSP